MFQKDITGFKNKLRDVDLPGFLSHLKLAPATRKFSPGKLSGKPKKSAVLILFYPKNNSTFLSLILRPVDDTVHSGQIAFPGGSMESIDNDLVDTALREANEEIGINITDVEIIGSLSKLYIPPSNFDVYPFVGFMTYNPVFNCNSEVDRLLEIEWNLLKNPAVVSKKQINTKYGIETVPCYFVNNNIIWGATSMIISELIDVLG